MRRAARSGTLLHVSASRSNEPRPRQDALGNKIPNPAEELALIEREIHDLKIAFERHFLSLERKPPTRRRDALHDRIRRLKSSGVMKGAVLKFRLEQLSSQFSSYDRMWTRTMSEMERGTYRRDVFKLRLRRSDAPPEVPPGPGSREAARRSEAAPEGDAQLSESQIRTLYDTLLVARKRTNESTAGLTYEGIKGTLQAQVPELLRKHHCNALDFKVVIKNGKAVLKAVPRRD